MNNWYIITGAPCSGKTTLLNELKARGYKTVDEAARTYIEAELQKGKALGEIRRDEVGFQHAILDLKCQIESSLSPREVIFFDRGIPDTGAYLRLHGIVPDSSIVETMKRSSYKKIFLLDPLDYQVDHVRTETAEEQRKIDDLLFNEYTDLGYEVVRIPALDVDSRIKMILEVL